ncbi:MAG: hypothetical protein AAB595_00395 [Patescibacteria group bacterium]
MGYFQKVKAIQLSYFDRHLIFYYPDNISTCKNTAFDLKSSTCQKNIELSQE